MPMTAREAESLEALILEIQRVALEFDRFGRYVKGEREHPRLESMRQEFENIGNTIAQATRGRRGLGKAGYGELAEGFGNIARLIRESSEDER